MNAIRLTLVGIVDENEAVISSFAADPASGPLVIAVPFTACDPSWSGFPNVRFESARAFVRTSLGSFFVEESVDDIANMLDARRV